MIEMTSRTDLAPTYACPCLNVRISPLSKSVSPEDGWKSVSVDENGIKIIYEHLTLKSRVSSNGHSLSCRLCNATVYRLPDGADASPSPTSATTPATPSRAPDFQSFFSTKKEMWIQICTTQQGVIAGSQLDAAFKRASPVFNVILPQSEAISPGPTPPSSNLSLPSMQAQQLLNWPDLFPPIPFVPNHPLFTSLAREAKKASTSKRTVVEEEIRQFVEQKRNEVIEAENILKQEVQTIWKAWKDKQDKGSVPQPIDPRTHTRRQSSTTSTNTKSNGPTVIRSFNEQPSTSPRESRPPAYSYSSSFSPSTMTPRVHAPMSALATSLRQSGMHMPRPPSPSPVSPLSPQNLPPSTSLGAGTPTPAARSKRPLEMAPTSPTTTSPPKIASPQVKKPKTSALKRQSIEVKKNGSPDTATTPSDQMSPVSGSFTGKRKAVTFSSDEPDVVTVTRQIKAERLQKIREEHARGEEPMFDLDEVEDTPAAKPKSPEFKNQEEQLGPSPAKKQRRVIKGFDDSDESVRLSFPVSPSNANSGKNRMEYTMAKSLPTTSILASSSLGLKMPASMRRSQQLASSLEAPYAAELLKMLAGQTPSHRSNWSNGGNGSADKRYKSNQSDDEDDKHDEDDQNDGDDTMEEDEEEYVPPSTSVPIPSMVRPVVQASADNDFEGAMSKSMDPGPVLEYLTDQRRGNTAQDEEDREADREASDLMKKLIEGRGSLHAQRILSHQNRGVPASMWRSLA